MTIRFENVRIPLGRDRRLIIQNWTLKSGEFWVIVGESGSGKSVLARTLAGVDAKGSNIRCVKGMERESRENERTAWIAFEREQLIREELRRNDDSEVMGMPDEGMLVKDFLETDRARDIAELGALRKLSDRGIRNLSTGEFRQALIAREVGREPSVAVLDEPFEGLDVTARPRLKAMLAEWYRSGILLVLTVSREEDIPEEATHLALLAENRLAVADRLEKALINPDVRRVLGAAGDKNLSEAQESNSRMNDDVAEVRFQKIPGPPHAGATIGDTLIQMNNLSLAFNGRPVLKDINWTVHRGESWLVTGPNGSGKTTLMNLISGDEPRGYGQDLSLFGRKRGSGETLADIRRNLSMASAAWQELAPAHSTALEIVESGLHDSLVSVERLNSFEAELSGKWLKLLQMEKRSNEMFFRLSYGERRLAMIARAMIKHPALLILDEPMHGLDGVSRRRVSGLVETLIEDTGTSVLFVSHRPNDAPFTIRNHLELRPSANGGPSVALITNRECPLPRPEHESGDMRNSEFQPLK